MHNLKVLFVHVPKRRGFYLPFGKYRYINMISQGMFAIVDLINRNGFETKFIHLGLEEILDKKFSFQQYLANFSPDVVIFSLHWHHQSFDVIETARSVKQTLPNAFIGLGGFTATHFASELIRDYDFIDAILCGHADQPTLELLKAIEQGTSNTKNEAGKPFNLDAVSNLVYRTFDGFKVNPVTYIHTSENMSNLRYANLGLLDNYKEYIETFSYPLEYRESLTRQENISLMYMGIPLFPLATGVGCPVQCSHCSGNHNNLKLLTGSGNVVWRDKGAVLDDIKSAISYGYRGFIMGFDPMPIQPQYYLELFEEIRKQQLDISCNFECWGLPTTEFIQSFANTFDLTHSEICLTPETPSERLRKLNRGYYFTNEELLHTIDVIKSFNLHITIFFSLALPHETIRDAKDTVLFADMLRSKHIDADDYILVWPAMLEPGSPVFWNASELGIEIAWKTFADFYKAHRDGHGDSYSSIGYKVLNYFGDERDNGDILDFEREIQKFKCQHFCWMFGNKPESSRLECLEQRKKIYMQYGLPTDSLDVFSEEHDMYTELKEFRQKRDAGLFDGFDINTQGSFDEIAPILGVTEQQPFR